MRKQVYLPYLIFALLGAGIILLVLRGSHITLENQLATCLIGLAMIALASNRLLYLRAAETVMAREKPENRPMIPIVLGYGLVYISISELGDYKLDRWHNSFDDKITSVLKDASSREGLVFIDPSDNLPVAVRLDGQTFLLEGTQRKRPFSRSFIMQMGKRNSNNPAVGVAGWLVLLQLILFFSGYFAYQYSAVHNTRDAMKALVFIPVSVAYFLPFIVGSFNRCKRGDVIFAINLLAGWTLAGWLVVCFLVWKDIRSRKHTA